MPEVRSAIIITTQVTSAAQPVTQWGVPVVLGVSTYSTKNTPMMYATQTDVEADHGSDSAIAKATASLFAQGLTKVYAVSVTKVGTDPTAGEMTTACGTCNALVAAGEIQGVVFAGITDITVLESLQTWTDTVKVIGVVCNAVSDTVTDQVTHAAALASNNVVFVSYKGSAGEDDVAAAVLGRIMVLKPWNTTAWKEVEVDVDEYYSSSDVVTLEAGNIVVIISYDGTNRLSTSVTTAATTRHLDVTRTQYYLEDAIKDAIAAGRMAGDKVPFTEKGLAVVRGWILTPLEGMVRNGALSKYSVVMPTVDQIADEDKAARVLKNVAVTAVTAGDIQTFNLGMTVEV